MKNNRILTFINISTIDSQYFSIAQVLNSFELSLILINFLEYLFIFHLLINYRAMHRNLHILVLLYGGQYFFSMLSRSIILTCQLLSLHNLAFLITLSNYIRTICVFLAFLMLPFLVFERCFATYFAETYEIRRHLWIPILLTLILIPMSVFSAISYVNDILPVYYHCTMFLVLNFGGSVLLFIIIRYNIFMHRTYSKLEKQKAQIYSLSERYQLSENIKTCCWLSRWQGFVLFFNIFCSSLLVLEQFLTNHLTIIIVKFAFNCFIIIYASVVPAIVINYTPMWSRETYRIWNKLWSRKSSQDHCLRTTFGEEMVYDDKQVESNLYFRQLEHDLNRKSNRKANVNSNSDKYIVHQDVSSADKDLSDVFV